jgi:TFIIF-interacting CTD phosphatase-like protein
MHRRIGLATAGATLAGYVWYQRTFRPLHVVWDLDETLLHSISPLQKAEAATLALPAERFFDHIDDDFDFEPGVPNTRTVLRPGMDAALGAIGLFAVQHVYTAAQGSYTEHILDVIDGQRTIFTSVIHRDLVPHHDATPSAPRGKDLTKLIDPAGQPLDLSRTILFDNRDYNFEPQPHNGVHVRDYTAVDVEFGGDVELLRLVAIALAAVFAPDVRPILGWFRTARHAKLCERLECGAATQSQNSSTSSRA